MVQNLHHLLKYRGLIQSLVVRDLKARYRGSVLGIFWSFANPFLLLVVYTLVFRYIMTNDDEVTRPYSVFLFCGLLPWTWFTASLLDASGSLITGGNLIKKVLFPAEVLPIVTVLANMVHFFIGLPILVIFLIYFRVPVDLSGLLWFSVVVLTQMVMTLGLALIVSALTVHFRDIKDILANLLMFWFFATPIIYPMSLTPGTARRLLNLNPFTHLAVSYQEILFYPGPFGHWKWLVALLAMSCGLFLLGYFLFDRLRDSFAEEV